MQTNHPANQMILKPATATLLFGAVLALTSCSSTPQSAQVDKTSVVAVQTGVPGGVVVDTYKSSATVTAIDLATRSLTVVSGNGATTTFQVRPEVANFDQIQVGDRIRATLTREVVIFLRKAGEPATDGESSTISLAAKGAKPGVVLANTVEVTATVTGIDLLRHEATLRFPDGTSKTIPVRPDVDLKREKIGQEVVIRKAESVAFLVEKE